MGSYIFVVDLVEGVGFGTKAWCEYILEDNLIQSIVDPKEVSRLGQHLQQYLEVPLWLLFSLIHDRATLF